MAILNHPKGAFQKASDFLGVFFSSENVMLFILTFGMNLINKTESSKISFFFQSWQVV